MTLVNMASTKPSRLMHLWRANSHRDDPSLSPRHSRAVLNMANLSLFGTAGVWGYTAFYALYDRDNLWPATIASAFSSLAFMINVTVLRKSVLLGCYFLFIWETASFTVLSYFFGGSSGLNLGFFVGSIFIVLLLGTSRPVALLAILIPSLIPGLCLPFLFASPALNGGTPDLLRMIFQSNVATLELIAATALFMAVCQVEIAETALAAEHARSEALLFNLLPEEIASRLKSAPGDVIADRLPEVTILLADIVDFTPRARRMEPQALAAFLNQIFSRFDTPSAAHGLEKIKTIGDA